MRGSNLETVFINNKKYLCRYLKKDIVLDLLSLGNKHLLKLVGGLKMSTKEKIIEELHKSARKRFPRRNTVLKGINDLHQADLVEMIPYSKENKGFKYILTVINCFTKVANAFPLKNKTSKVVVEAMRKYLKTSNNTCKHLQTDMGKEFYNSAFKKLMEEYNINHYSTFSEIKGAIIERFNRTLKGAMFKKFSLQGNYKWYNILKDLINQYNNKRHRTIGMKPFEVNKSNEHIVKTRIQKQTLPKLEKRLPKTFNLNDEVRISKTRNIFAKKYHPNWTNEVFKIYKIQPSYPETYILKDKKGEILHGSFYGHELMKTDYGDVYLIEKILKKKGNKMLVRWLTFDKTEDSWINKNDIL